MNNKSIIGFLLILSFVFLNSCKELECVSGDIGDLGFNICISLRVDDKDSKGIDGYPVRIEAYYTDCYNDRSKIKEFNGVTHLGDYWNSFSVTISSRKDLVTIYMYIGSGENQLEQVREFAYDDFDLADEYNTCLSVSEKWIVYN